MKKCIVIVNKYKKIAGQLADKIIIYLESINISCERYLFSGDNEELSFENFDFAITLGGDGTVLFAARKCAPFNIPVFPINFGQFGFIAGINKAEWKRSLDEFLSGSMQIATRSMIAAEVFRKNTKIFESTALNDVVIKSAGSAQFCELHVACNSQDFGRFKADGVIIATPTGSTAYSAAAGGPIVDPSLDVIIFNAICALSLSNRSVVLNQDSELSVLVQDSRSAEIKITCDGQVSCCLLPGDVVKIYKAKEKALLAGCGCDVFYTALKSKLNWSGGPND